MKYIVYKTTNTKSKVNNINKIYVGVHKTNDPNNFDGYLGCGIYINQPSTYSNPTTPFHHAVIKYGLDAFVRETLFIYDNEKDAYDKEREIVNLDFLKQPYTYNACLGGNYYNMYKPLYQFDLQGNLIKKWDYSKEAYDYYGLPLEKFEYAIHDKHPLLDCYWSASSIINISEYSSKIWGNPKATHLYDKSGKWLGEFESRKKCADYIETEERNIVKAIQQGSLVQKMYYVSDNMYDEYIPEKKVQYSKSIIYVYNNNSKLLGKGIGKEILSIINETSWNKVRDSFRYKQGWHNEFYLSLEEIDKVPERILKNKIKVDVYDNNGYIETLESVKEVKIKYKVPASKIKNLDLGDRCYNNYIFKLHK